MSIKRRWTSVDFDFAPGDEVNHCDVDTPAACPREKTAQRLQGKQLFPKN